MYLLGILIVDQLFFGSINIFDCWRYNIFFCKEKKKKTWKKEKEKEKRQTKKEEILQKMFLYILV